MVGATAGTIPNRMKWPREAGPFLAAVKLEGRLLVVLIKPPRVLSNEPVAKLFGTPLIAPLKSRQCIYNPSDGFQGDIIKYSALL
jgi:hypothetical protein